MAVSGDQKNVLFDVEQLTFQRLREGSTKLGLKALCHLTQTELRRWLALPLYSSTFLISPQQRTDKLATVVMYDEAGKPIASVEVEYVVSVCISGHFHSVPVVFVSEERDNEKGAAACRYLNTSLHQSQVVTSPGFVAIQPTGASVDVVSMTHDGEELRRMTM